MTPSLDFELLFNSLPGAFLVLTPEFTVVAASDALLTATMTRREAIVGRNVFDALPDDPRNPTGFLQWRASLERVLQTRATDIMPLVKYSMQRPAAEGGGFTEKYWRPENVPVPDANGEVIYIIHRTEEVTELQVSREAALEARRRTADAESRMAFALQAAEIGDWELNLVTGKAFRSLKHDQCFGYQELQPSWTLQDALRHIHPEDRERVERAHLDAAGGKGDMRFDCRVLWPDKSLHWIRVRGRVEHDGAGRPLRLAGLVWETTELKLVEERLETEAHKLEAIFRHAPAAVALLRGADLVFEKANASYREVIGGRDPIGKPFREALPELAGQAFHDLLRRVFETGEPFTAPEMKALIIRRPGSEPEEVYFHFTYGRVDDAQGRPYGVFIHAMDITDRVSTREALRASEERLSLALSSSNLGFWDWNAQTGATFLSDTLMQSWGIDPATYRNTLPEAMERIHPDDRGRVWAEIRRSTSQKLPYDVEYRVIRPEGTLLHVNAKGRCYTDDRGQPLRLTGVVRDITAEKEAREKLLTLAAIVENSSDFIGHSDAGLNANFLNPGGRKLVGLSEDTDIASIPLLNFFDESDHKRVVDEVLPSVQGNRRWLGELKFRHFVTGKSIPVIYDLFPIRNPGDGKVIAFATVTRDISEIEAQRAALAKSEADFRTLANSIPQLAWMADETGYIFWYNQRWYDYTGTTFDEMKGWGWDKVHHPDHSGRVVAFVKEAWTRNEPWELLFPLRKHTGEWGSFLTRAVPISDSNGRIVRWLGTNTDISEQTEARAALQEALRTREEFLSIASHELKTPVTSLKLHLQMLRRGVHLDEGLAPSPATLVNALDSSNRQVDRLTVLIEELLDVTRLEAGQMRYDFEPVELSALVREVVARFSGQLGAAACSVEVSAAEGVTVLCDRFRIEQVVTNLITNAIKYAAGTAISIDIARTATGGRIRVRDRGPGIALENQARVFDRFERAVSHHNISGLGLGLYISRQIVDAHGGHIGVWSEPGEGSTFIVELPRDPAGIH